MGGDSGGHDTGSGSSRGDDSPCGCGAASLWAVLTEDTSVGGTKPHGCNTHLSAIAQLLAETKMT